MALGSTLNFDNIAIPVVQVPVDFTCEESDEIDWQLRATIQADVKQWTEGFRQATHAGQGSREMQRPTCDKFEI